MIDDNRVSGVHFEIWREFVTTRDEEGNEKVQTIVRLRDLSSNGTFVRRQKVGKGNITILHDGVDVALNVTSDVETDEKGQEIRVPSYCESIVLVPLLLTTVLTNACSLGLQVSQR